jgi:hypothetical protein
MGVSISNFTGFSDRAAFWCAILEVAAHADLPNKFEFILELAALDLDGWRSA